MALTIQTNLASLGAQRFQGEVGRRMGISLNRLSSGFRINRAADDASGLAIADRMTSKIRAFNQAARNANDGISLSQTAEGGLAQITVMLQRLRELAVQSANFGLSEGDRQSLQAEASQLSAEIDNIAKNTRFNQINLLDGSLSQTFQVGADVGETIGLSLLGAADSETLLSATVSITTTVPGIPAVPGTPLIPGIPAVADSWATMASTTNSLDSQATVVGDKIYDIYADTLRIYDPATDVVTTQALGADIRYYHGSAAVGDKIYFFGGQTMGGAASDKVWEFDTVTSTLTAKAAMPWGTQFPQTQTVNGKVYVFGGSAPSQAPVITDSTWEYDPAADAWTVMTAMPTGRSLAASAVVDDKIYLIGGVDAAAAKMDQVDVYDPATDGWSTVAPMSIPRDLHMAETIDGKIYVFGNRGPTSSVESYDPVADTWTAVTNMPTGVSSASTGVVNGKAYVLGGSNTWIYEYTPGQAGTADVPATPGTAAVPETTVSTTHQDAPFDLSSQEEAQKAIAVADAALLKVAEQRSTLGATLNRLESAMANLQTMGENLYASRSRIRDADIAVETAKMAKNAILQQAVTSILAQANQQPQLALELL